MLLPLLRLELRLPQVSLDPGRVALNERLQEPLPGPLAFWRVLAPPVSSVRFNITTAWKELEKVECEKNRRKSAGLYDLITRLYKGLSYPSRNTPHAVPLIGAGTSIL